MVIVLLWIFQRLESIGVKDVEFDLVILLTYRDLRWLIEVDFDL